MPCCFECRVELTINNRTREHILLNAIGGRLVSENLYCRHCNSSYGHECDSELAKQLSQISSFLQVKRDHGEHPPIKNVIGTSGTKYVLEGGFKAKLAFPTVRLTRTEDGYTVNGQADGKEMQKILQTIKERNPDFDLEDALKNVKEAPPFSEPLQMPEISMNGNLINRAILKSALNFYLHHGGDVNLVNHLHPFLTEEVLTPVVYGFPLQDHPYDVQPNEIYHILHLVANRAEQILYVYVEFFSSFSYVVILSDNYSGEDYQKTYSYEVITGEERNNKITVNLTRSFESDLNERLKDQTAIIEKRLSKIFHIGAWIHLDNAYFKIKTDLSEQLEKLHQEGKFIPLNLVVAYGQAIQRWGKHQKAKTEPGFPFFEI